MCGLYIMSHGVQGALVARFVHRRYVNYLLLRARAVGLLDVEPDPAIFVLVYLRVTYDEPSLFWTLSGEL